MVVGLGAGLLHHFGDGLRFCASLSMCFFFVGVRNEKLMTSLTSRGKSVDDELERRKKKVVVAGEVQDAEPRFRNLLASRAVGRSIPLRT